MTEKQKLEMDLLNDLYFTIQEFYSIELQMEIPKEMEKVLVLLKERGGNVVPWNPTPEEIAKL